MYEFIHIYYNKDDPSSPRWLPKAQESRVKSEIWQTL